MLTVNNNVCMVHIIVNSVLITCNYCNAFLLIKSTELIHLCTLYIGL